jgi:NAD(P)-dependent dehydrogenase (short-subunit alcohol dehydrogenase family)
MTWTAPSDLSGTRVVLTGATGGLGHHVAADLAGRGAELHLLVRDVGRGAGLLERLGARSPHAQVHLVEADLADLGSIERAARRLRDSTPSVDVLVNNAGIMLAPNVPTADGFPLQLGTNHLGHFALTAHLVGHLSSTGRVVTVSSVAAARARHVDLEALASRRADGPDRRWRAYAESKLANLLFASELARRWSAAGSGRTSVAAHPGLAATEITQTGMSMGHPVLGRLLTLAIRPGLQSAVAGARPILRAALDPTLASGDYVGPSWPGHTRGRPVLVRMPRRATDVDLARRLWSASEDAAGVGLDV